MNLTFCGAAKIVTGSCYLLEVGKRKILVDCGMFQGTKEITRKNYEEFPFDAAEIDYVLLTHAHIDHTGLLPKLAKKGFLGYIYATPATIDLSKIMLEDSANLQLQDTEMENRRRQREGLPPREPIYLDADVQRTIELFKKAEYDEPIKIDDSITVTYRDAGHIIGSAILEVVVIEKAKTTKIVFSGDLGQWNVPIVRDPTFIDDADYVLIESTYGDRLHEDIKERDDKLSEYLKKTFSKGGKLLIPSFAVERTQELIYSLHNIMRKHEFPNEKIYLDSPLAVKATEIFKKHPECFDEETYSRQHSLFNLPNLVYVKTTEDSKKLNGMNKPCVIIAGSGMCNGGRIRHHLKHGISNPKNTILFVGYQAEGTLGRVILEGAKKVRMMGEEFDVKADVGKINSFSAHADSDELINWMSHFQTKPKKVFIVHGEERSAKYLLKKLNKKGFNCYIPSLGEKAIL